jgi:hypothetical protein
VHQDEIPTEALYLLILRTLVCGWEMHGHEIADCRLSEFEISCQLLKIRVRVVE